MQSVIVTVVVVVIGIIVVVLAIYILLYFCGNCCGKEEDDDKADDIEMQAKARQQPIHESDVVSESEKAPLLNDPEVGSGDSEPAPYSEYTLNDKGEKVKEKPVEVDDDEKPRLYPQVDPHEPVPPEAMDKKPLYPDLDNAPVVTEVP